MYDCLTDYMCVCSCIRDEWKKSSKETSDVDIQQLQEGLREKVM